MRLAAEPFAVNAHHVPAGVVIDHRLPRLPVLGAAQKQPAVRPEIVVHFQRHLEVAISLVRDDESAIPGFLASVIAPFFTSHLPPL